ncbi:cysteine hydrolase family protein [Elizabethkingia anophelis]|uniref:Uncharacterized protein n=1 Tax=Elizabethkingia anophelis TaxID=1117645 RepID=A0AAU8VGG8_9FLAO|nr:hypothetical protein [Elizabethkingia anophelis]AQX02220.1 hypothetical protein BBD32_12475 [Elizabethkingia anophelis]OPB61677.1 hypothetical protein BAY11_17460 [Elizabethkingia anophelis]
MLYFKQLLNITFYRFLVIDIQNDYFYGKNMTLVGADETAKKTQQLLEYYKRIIYPLFIFSI